MRQYVQLLKQLVNTNKAVLTPNRTGTDAYTINPVLLEFKGIRNRFPLLTLRRIPFNIVVEELIWFLRGDTNVKYLNDKNVTIWDEWADVKGNLGPIYGKQWNDWNGINQIENIVNGLKKDPHSRRHILSAWNVGELDQMRLHPCHVMCQFYIYRNKLNAYVTMRSSDVFLGLPYNIASYATLLLLIGKTIHRTTGDLTMCLNIPHLYVNHLEPANKLLEVAKDLKIINLPHLEVPKIKSSLYNNLTADMFVLKNYEPILKDLTGDVAV